MVSFNNSSYSQPYAQSCYGYPPADDRSVDTNQAISHAARYDVDQNGVLDRFEIDLAAKAAERIDQSLSELFYTFNEGGINGQGLLPDTNNNGGLDLWELTDLGNQDGIVDRISVGDVKKGFPGQTVDGGNNINDPYGSPQGGGMQEMVMNLMMALLQMLMQPKQKQQSYLPSPPPVYSPIDAYSNPFAGMY